MITTWWHLTLPSMFSYLGNGLAYIIYYVCYQILCDNLISKYGILIQEMNPYKTEAPTPQQNFTTMLFDDFG